MIPGIDPKVWNAVADLLSERDALPAAADVVAETGCAESEALAAIDAYARYHALPDTVASIAEPYWTTRTDAGTRLEGIAQTVECELRLRGTPSACCAGITDDGQTRVVALGLSDFYPQWIAGARVEAPAAKPTEPTPRQVWEAAFQAETAICLAFVKAKALGADPAVLDAMARARDLAREATRRALLAIPGPEQRQRGASWRL